MEQVHLVGWWSESGAYARGTIVLTYEEEEDGIFNQDKHGRGRF